MTELSQVKDVADPSLATLETFDANLSIIQIGQSYSQPLIQTSPMAFVDTI